MTRPAWVGLTGDLLVCYRLSPGGTNGLCSSRSAEKGIGLEVKSKAAVVTP